MLLPCSICSVRIYNKRKLRLIMAEQIDSVGKTYELYPGYSQFYSRPGYLD
jgi:hypothetical protein